MPGYQTDIFKTRLESQYLCKFCQLALKDPWQKKTCGHRYCRECIDVIISFSTRLETRLCQACRDETGQIEEIYIPISMDEVFEDRGTKRDMAHLRVKCKECGWNGIFTEYDELHVKTCTIRPHNSEVANVQSFQENCLEPKMSKLLKDAKNSNTRNNSYTMSLTSSQGPETSEYCSSDANSVSNRRILLLSAKIALNSKKSTIQDERLAENKRRIQELETTSYDGKFIWKITKFSNLLNQVFLTGGRTTPLLSPNFYVGRSGYKMCASLLLTDNRSGKFHVHIMRGDFDAILEWPFLHQVNMLLLDQEGANNLMKTVEPRLSLLPSNRPMTEVNPALGCLEFTIPNDWNSSRYFKEDTAYFKVVVAADGLQL
ncbi:TNF receptor-associated factor 2-like [Ptychodera flava]|uniref:TNF receptor-associated factor 2-like n=1 Tax=Ptychodera flava TaxID=63121 RepID=UPI00396A0DE2